MSDPLFDPWCSTTPKIDGTKTLSILIENKAARPKALQAIHALIPNHYFPDGILQHRLRRLGRLKTAQTIQAILPTTKKAMSGDLGEILATEYVNRKLSFATPILRLRWKDGRDLALRGDDILAVKTDLNGDLHFLKGEVKSRKQLSPSTVEQAVKALGTNHGRPTAYVVNFVVNRLYEAKENTLAEALEDHLTSKLLPVKKLTHLLFTLSGNDSTSALTTHLTGYQGKIAQVVVGVVIEDHQDFIALAFGGVSA